MALTGEDEARLTAEQVQRLGAEGIRAMERTAEAASKAVANVERLRDELDRHSDQLSRAVDEIGKVQTRLDADEREIARVAGNLAGLHMRFTSAVEDIEGAVARERARHASDADLSASADLQLAAELSRLKADLQAERAQQQAERARSTSPLAGVVGGGAALPILQQVAEALKVAPGVWVLAVAALAGAAFALLWARGPRRRASAPASPALPPPATAPGTPQVMATVARIDAPSARKSDPRSSPPAA